MKLYTKRGDRGQTDLFGGARVPKHHARVEAYGTVDELNAVIGLALSAIGSEQQDVFVDVDRPLRVIQSRLFEIGAELATPNPPASADTSAKGNTVPRLQETQITELEDWIDTASEAVPPMKTFILPGGCELSSRLHVARTVCRRAERCVAALADQEPISDRVGVYLNRLSDLLFALARHANHLAAIPDAPWLSPRQRKHDLF